MPAADPNRIAGRVTATIKAERMEFFKASGEL
jgi:hypothetical protein